SQTPDPLHRVGNVGYDAFNLLEDLDRGPEDAFQLTQDAQLERFFEADDIAFYGFDDFFELFDLFAEQLVNDGFRGAMESSLHAVRYFVDHRISDEAEHLHSYAEKRSGNASARAGLGLGHQFGKPLFEGGPEVYELEINVAEEPAQFAEEGAIIVPHPNS